MRSLVDIERIIQHGLLKRTGILLSSSQLTNSTIEGDPISWQVKKCVSQLSASGTAPPHSYKEFSSTKMPRTMLSSRVLCTLVWVDITSRISNSLWELM